MTTLHKQNPIPIKDYFQEIKGEFLNSLKKSAALVVDDEYIKQMFENNLTKAFIPDRICELVNKILTDDREKYISNLVEKLNSIEIIFGSERMEKLVQIGTQLSDLFNIPVFNEEEYIKQLNLLALLLNDLLNENDKKINKKSDNELSIGISNKEINLSFKQKSDIKNLSSMLNNIKQNVKQFQEEALKSIQTANQQLKQKISSQSNLKSTFENDRKELLKTIENQSIQIDQLTKQMQSNSSSLSFSQSKDKLEKKIEKAKLIIQQLNESNSSFEANQKILEEKIEHLKEVNSQLKQQVQQNANQMSPSITQKMHLRNAEDEIETLKEENSILKESSEKQKSKFQQRLRTLEIELQHQRDLQSQMKSSQMDEKDKIIDELTNQNKVLISTIQNNEKKIYSKKQKLHKLQEMLENASNADEKQKVSIESLSSENANLLSKIKKISRDLRIQQQVNEEYSQQIEELKKVFTKNQDQSKDAIELIRERLSSNSEYSHFSTLIEGIRRLFQQIDEKDTRILSLENQKQSLSSTINYKDRENAQIQITLKQMTEQLQNNSQIRSQYDSQQSIIDESKDTIQKLNSKMEKYKKKAKDLYQSLTDVSIQRDDLLEYKDYCDNLKKQNQDLQKELKNAKQKLYKYELDAQTTASLSQRQYSEQLKDLSRQIRESNNKIQRITAQASKSIPIESFDDIPKVFSDLKQQINKTNSLMTKIKNILQVKNDDDLITEAKNLKQDNNALQDFLKETASTLNATSLKRCSKAISELKDEIEAANQREQNVCQILLIKDPSKIEKKLQNVMESNKIITRVISALHVSDEDQISSKITNLVSLYSILKEHDLSKDEQLMTHFQQFDSMIAEKKIIQEKLKGNENLEETVQKLMNHCNELEKIQFKLKIDNDRPERVDDLLQYEKDMKEIFDILQVQEYSEIVQTISELVTANNGLIEEEEKIMAALAVMTPDSIFPKINDLSKQITSKTAFIDNICEQLGVRDSSKLNEKISNLIAMKTEYKTSKKLLKTDTLTESVRIMKDNLNDLQLFVNEICSILKVNDANHIKTTIKLLLKENEEFHSIDLMFPMQFSGSVKERISKILKAIKETKDFYDKICQHLKITKIEDIEPTIMKIGQSQEIASELISEMLKSLLSDDVEIKLPITQDEKERLLSIFHDNFKRNEEMKNQIGLILNKAMNFGYRGNNCSEAVDTIVAAFSEADKQTLSDRMQEELMTVRAASENEKKSSEKQIEKYKKTINKLKQQIIEIQETSAKKEMEFSQMLQSEKEKSMELASDLGNEQRIHNELIQLLNGQIHDEKFLMANLNKKDSSIVQEAEKTIANVSSMSQSLTPNKAVKFK